MIGDWTCHICKEKRPDDKISVQSVPLIVNGQVYGQQNIRYCNDQQSCIDSAKDFKGWLKKNI